MKCKSDYYCRHYFYGKVEKNVSEQFQWYLGVDPFELPLKLDVDHMKPQS